MSSLAETGSARRHSGVPLVVERAPLIPLVPFGMALGCFLAISFVLCVLYYVIMPEAALNHAILRALPGLKVMTWPSFFLGLVEAFAYGWFVALVFVPIYNFFVLRLGRRGRTT